MPIIPGYEILGVIATGGHSTVYKARRDGYEPLVAIKVGSPTGGPGVDQHFDHERRALHRLSGHGGILSLRAGGDTDQGLPYIVVDYVPGGSVAQRLLLGPVDFDEATAGVIGVAAALERAHNCGILHLDVKPANILCSDAGTWLLADFGVAAIDGRTPIEHQAFVSYPHTAPEIVAGASPSVEADVYSLASVLATCLSGSEPFAPAPDEDDAAALHRIVIDPHPSVGDTAHPHELGALLAASLSNDPSDRPVSAWAFGAALNHIRRQHGYAVVPMLTGDEGSIADTSPMSAADMATAAALAASHEPNGSTITIPAHQRRRRRRRRAVVAMVVGLAALAPVGLEVAASAEPQPVQGRPTATGFAPTNESDAPSAFDDDADRGRRGIDGVRGAGDGRGRN